MSVCEMLSSTVLALLYNIYLLSNTHLKILQSSY